MHQTYIRNKKIKKIYYIKRGKCTINTQKHSFEFVIFNQYCNRIEFTIFQINTFTYLQRVNNRKSFCDDSHCNRTPLKLLSSNPLTIALLIQLEHIRCAAPYHLFLVQAYLCLVSVINLNFFFKF